MKNPIFKGLRPAIALFFGFSLLLAFSGCSKDETTNSDLLVGNWEVKTLTVDAQGIVPNQMEFDFDSDGDFDFFFLSGNNQVRMSGNWRFTNNDTELELDYTVNQTFFVGLVGFIQGADFPNEEYSITFVDNNEIDLEGTINGLRVEMNLERD